MPSGIASWRAITEGIIRNCVPRSRQSAVTAISDIVGKPDIAEVLDSIGTTEFAVKEYLLDQLNSPKYAPTDHDRLRLARPPLQRS